MPDLAPPVSKRARKPFKPAETIVAQAAETAVAAVVAAPAAIATALDPVPTTTPAPVAATIAEGQADMATIAPEIQDTAKGFADKAQSAFGDATARAQAAFDKSSRYGEEFAEFARGNVEALVASARVVAKGGETIAQDAVEYGKKSFEHATSAFKGFAAAKSPTELFQLQSDFARTAFDQAVAEASKFSEAMLKLAGDAAQPLSSRYAVAAEKVKATTSF